MTHTPESSSSQQALPGWGSLHVHVHVHVHVYVYVYVYVTREADFP